MDIRVDPFIANAPESGGLTRAEGLWLADCGLIIQAETTLFRVSRDFLAIQSPIFRDMLSLPTPDDAEMMDGCPFVLLSDSAEDITVFLKALLYHDFFEPYPAPTTLPILTGVLRMSHKYEVDSLRKRALVHISSFLPTTLLEYENLTRKSTPWFNELRESDVGFLDIIALARDLSIDWILPIAYYRGCEFSWERTILEGPLGIEDKVRLMTACRVLESACVSKILAFLWPTAQIEGCGSPLACSADRIDCRRTAEQWRERDPNAAAMMPLHVWEARDWGNLDVCDICLSSMKIAHQEAKQALWDSLPELFGLPEWSELEKLKAAALQ
ncbi:hypothetical protein B0H19DRAFT_1183764 [Mycena capillaripes]|nr:hypothetical protein B0H19DRAFT_1183764 [Mycena capillaripes]